MALWLKAELVIVALLVLPGLWFLARAAAPGFRYCDPKDLRRAWLLLGPGLFLSGLLTALFAPDRGCCGWRAMPPELAGGILMLIGLTLALSALFQSSQRLIESAESGSKSLEDLMIDEQRRVNEKLRGERTRRPS